MSFPDSRGPAGSPRKSCLFISMASGRSGAKLCVFPTLLSDFRAWWSPRWLPPLSTWVPALSPSCPVLSEMAQHSVDKERNSLQISAPDLGSFPRHLCLPPPLSAALGSLGPRVLGSPRQVLLTNLGPKAGAPAPLASAHGHLEAPLSVPKGSTVLGTSPVGKENQVRRVAATGTSLRGNATTDGVAGNAGSGGKGAVPQVPG